jgi:hypothetical protein
MMDIAKMIAQLRAEREHVEEAIVALERLPPVACDPGGRPPPGMTKVKRRGLAAGKQE